MKNQSIVFKRSRVLSVSGIVLLLFGFTILILACKQNAATKAAEVSPVVEVHNSALAQNSYADVVNRVAPGVATIRADRRVRAAEQFPFMNDPFFREFFGDRSRNMPREPQDRLQRGVGSGVIVSADGYLLTNHHVVDGAADIRVELSDNRTLSAKVVGSDPPSDLALLKVDARDLPTLSLGDSDRVRVGDVVLAVGNPLGVGQTVTMGIISAKGRQTGLSDGSFEDFLQTDAPINQGNSGGALVNTSGELIGINSQILSTSGGNIGLGFAIPANMAKGVMDQLLKSGKVRRGMIGVTIQPVTSDLATSLGLSSVRGALVNGVQSGGPAERAGVRRGDVIVAINGQPVADSNALRNQIARTQPGAEVPLTVLRDNREQQIRVTLGELPAERSSAENNPGGPGGDTGKLGIRVEPLTPSVAAQLNLPANIQGLLVTSLDPGGPAAEAGVRQNDVIEEVNRQPVKSAADLQAAIQRSGAKPILLLLNRGGNNIFLTVRPRQ
jgi:serine protease Do